VNVRRHQKVAELVRDRIPENLRLVRAGGL
jgi:hypothetical protein